MKKIPLFSKGFSTVPILAGLLVLVVIGAAGWKVYGARHAASKNATPAAARDSKPETSKKAIDPYPGWKTYDNQTYGFSFRYPAAWSIEEVSATAPPGADSQEFAVNLTRSATEKYNGTAQFEIHAAAIAAVKQFYEDYYDQSPLNQVKEGAATLKGKQAIAYEVTNSGVLSKRYIFSVGNKAYSLVSNNEELNQQRSPSYWQDFNKVFESLKIE